MSIYDNINYTGSQMYYIRYCVLEGLDISLYPATVYNAKQIGQIVKGLEQGFDISIYSDKRFSGDQMCEIRTGIENKIDASLYADPNLSVAEMQSKRKKLIVERRMRSTPEKLKWCRDHGLDDLEYYSDEKVLRIMGDVYEDHMDKLREAGEVV